MTLNCWRRTFQPVYYALHRLIAQNRKKAAKRNIIFSIKKSHLQIAYDKQRGICPLTGIKLRFAPGLNMRNASLDRIQPSKGYVPGNIRLVCWWANIARSNMTDVQFRKWCRRAI